jgi:hypothetical protein
VVQPVHRLLLAATVALLLGAATAGCSGKPASTPAADSADFSTLGLEATATTGVIRGIVVDQAIRPIGNATVALTPGDKATRTTAEGTFGFDGLEPGSYFLRVTRSGYNATQASATVVAGVADPTPVKVLLSASPTGAPYFEAYSFDAFITCGFAVVATSVGCDTFDQSADALGDHVYFPLHFTTVPRWVQGELVWTQTQAAGGMAIWQLEGCADTETDTAGSHYCDGPPSQESPALTKVGPDLIDKNAKSMLADGVQFNLFGGPHPACNQAFYGCGVTLQQRFQVFAHAFYNFVPADGWRFTSDGDPVLPQ